MTWILLSEEGITDCISFWLQILQLTTQAGLASLNLLVPVYLKVNHGLSGAIPNLALSSFASWISKSILLISRVSLSRWSRLLRLLLW